MARKLKSELTGHLSIVKMADMAKLLYPIHPDVVDKVSRHPAVTSALARMPDPTLVKDEAKYYKPFVNLANVIAEKYADVLEKLCKEKKGLQDDHDILSINDEHQKHVERISAKGSDRDAVLHWATKPNNAPEACEKTTSAIRPDAACVLVPEKPKQVSSSSPIFHDGVDSSCIY